MRVRSSADTTSHSLELRESDLRHFSAWMDGIPAPPKKPWHEDSPVNANKQWFPVVSKWCRIPSIRSMAFSVANVKFGYFCWKQLRM